MELRLLPNAYRSLPHLLRIVALSRQPDLHGECTYGRLSTWYEKREAPRGIYGASHPVPYGPVSGKEGRARERAREKERKSESESFDRAGFH